MAETTPTLPAAPRRLPPLDVRRLMPLAGVAGALLLALTAYAGTAALAAGVAFLLGLMLWGWPVLLALPAPRGTWAATGIAAVLAIVAVALTRTDPLLEWLPLAAAGGVVVSFGHQLVRRDGRPRLVESLAGEVVALVLIVSAAALVALPRADGGADVVLTLAAAAAALSLVELVGLPERLVAALGAIGAAAAGALAAGLAARPTALFGALLGLVFAVVAIVVRRLFLAQPTLSHPTAALSLAVTPLAASGIVAYVLARLFVG